MESKETWEQRFYGSFSPEFLELFRPNIDDVYAQSVEEIAAAEKRGAARARKLALASRAWILFSQHEKEWMKEERALLIANLEIALKEYEEAGK